MDTKQIKMKHLEIKTVEFNGIKVCLKINYDKGTASLVDGSNGAPYGQYQAKKYVFAEREVSYMEGWLNILTAMRVAVLEAKKELEADSKKKEKSRHKLIEKVIKAGKAD